VNDPIILLPRDYAKRIERCGKSFGYLDARQDQREQVFIVDGFWKGNEGGVHGISEWVKQRHYLGHAELEPKMGLWYHVDHAVHELGLVTAVRRSGFVLDTFRDGVQGGWVAPGMGSTLAITYADRPDGEREWAGWVLDGAQQAARRIDLQVVDEEMPVMAPLVDHWPLLELATEQVVVIGAGSIGSAANDALVAYGIRSLALVDPDRLLGHNFARHRSHPGQLGRRKVTAEKQRLIDREPSLDIEGFTADVIDDADLMRPLFADASLILVTSDGVESRRVANHLARRAGKPVVFACVLMDGSYGEVLRIPTPAVGCLLCARDELIRSGAMVNPEGHLDRDYGTGTRHLPMTAVGGDLGLVGQLAAKAAVATLLQARGHGDQRLPGDHAVLGLRPRPGLAEPFNIEFAGEIRWRQLPPPRRDCPTCSAPA
jgi:molybdopterin/thiamine biosynthesis adenylyltransferase